jgi:dTMP kinase
MAEKRLISGGAYFVLEGPGKSGKTSVLLQIAEILTRRGLPIVTTREPGGPQEAEDLRQEIFLLKSQGELDPIRETEMFYEARALSMIWVVSCMREGKIVLKDRDFISTEVFQVVSGVGRSKLESMHEELYRAKNFPNPDMRLIIFPSYKTIQNRRRGSEGDAFDEQKEEIIKGYYAGYGDLAYDIHTKGRRCHPLLAGDTVVVNAVGDLNSVVRKTMPHILRKLHEIRVKYPHGRDFEID